MSLAAEANRIKAGQQVSTWNDQITSMITQARSIMDSMIAQKTAMTGNPDFTTGDVTEITSMINALKTAALVLTV